jgi:aspartyl-tRNA(Asn)/glutamyl-tRNA(Gln) amidotransferase subunit A
MPLSSEFFTIAEAARLISAGELSPVELVDHCLARIERIDPILHSFITVTADSARIEAKAAERQIAKSGPLGPLHGIPIGLKDIFNTKGVRTTAHSEILEHNVPDSDASVVRLLRQSGAISLGKLALMEFAIGGAPAGPIWPEPRNPWHLDKWPGGSSSGTGAAVAAGLVLGGMGSDTGGSIRVPSALCGLAGIKPTYGLVSRSGMLPLAFSLDHAGPMAWTVEDCAILLQAIAGPDREDPASSGRPSEDYVGALSGSIKGKRIGVLRDLHEREAPSSPALLKSIEDAVSIFKSHGAEIHDVVLPPLADWSACGILILYAEAYAIHEKWLQSNPESYGKAFRGRIAHGAFISSADYIQALRKRRELMAAMDAVMQDVDVLMTAVFPVEAIDANLIPTIFPSDQPAFTVIFNVTGQPAMSICSGFNDDGLPLAIHLAARAFDERTLFQVANAYERSTNWRARRPSLVI